MTTTISYKWVKETIHHEFDENDVETITIVQSEDSETFPGLPADYTERVGVRCNIVNEGEAINYESFAYIRVNNTLPKQFRDVNNQPSRTVPKRFHDELAAALAPVEE